MAINEDTHENLELKFLERIGWNLSSYRKTSQEEVLEKLKSQYGYQMSRQHLSDIERGKAKLTLYETVMFCNIYHVSIEDILTKDTDVYKQKRKIPPYESRIQKNMSEKDMRKLISEYETLVKNIYELFRQEVL